MIESPEGAVLSVEVKVPDTKDKLLLTIHEQGEISIANAWYVTYRNLKIFDEKTYQQKADVSLLNTFFLETAEKLRKEAGEENISLAIEVLDKLEEKIKSMQ